MAISKRLRHEVMRRDGYTCQYCFAAEVPLTIDHVIPQALGGSDKPSNLVAACIPCNAGKTSTLPGADFVERPDPEALNAAREELHPSDYHDACWLAVFNEMFEKVDELLGSGISYWLEPDEGRGAIFHRRKSPCFGLWEVAYHLYESPLRAYDEDSAIKQALNPNLEGSFCIACCSREAGSAHLTTWIHPDDEG